MPISEHSLYPYIKALVEEYGELNVTELNEKLRPFLSLDDDDDLAILKGRKDDRFSQIVRNIVSHAPDGISHEHGFIIDKTYKPTRFYAISPLSFKKGNSEINPINQIEINERSIIKRKFNTKKVDFKAINEIRSVLGNFGEAFALEWEKDRLYKLKAPFNVELETIRVSQIYGDGAGYDILSRDHITCKPRYIEVKTTQNDFNAPFFMSINEKAFLETFPNAFIYRVYNFDMLRNIGELKIITKEELLKDYIFDPIDFKVHKK